MSPKDRRKATIVVSDRYSALGIPRPHPETVCRGKCEGVGLVPVKRDAPAPFDALWLAAEAKSPTDDGYHFVTCPACKGTGKRFAEPC